jgi:hypothetical protein
MFQLHAFICFSGVFHMLHMYVSYVNAQLWKNDAYAHVMQVQWCKAKTWGVTTHMQHPKKHLQTYMWTYTTSNKNTCNIRLEKQMKHLKQTLATYLYSHCNICNIPIYFCNIYTKTLAPYLWNICNNWNICLQYRGREQGWSIRAVRVEAGGVRAPPTPAALIGALGSTRDDLRCPGTCAEPPSVGVVAVARGSDPS